jgi:hypothetical protein
MTIIPDDIYCDNIDTIVVTGFRQGDEYFIIQREDFDATNIHIELNDQGQGCYDGLEEIIILDDKIVFKLNLNGQEILGTDSIVISDKLTNRTEYKKLMNELNLLRDYLKR